MVTQLYVEPGQNPVHAESCPPARFQRGKFLRELGEFRLPLGPGRSSRVTDTDLAGLPAAAQRYLRFMRVLGRPRTWSFRARSAGVFRVQPNRPWTACEAWQYDTSLEIARIFSMRLRVGLVPIVLRDLYMHGEGRMLGRVLDTFSVLDRSDDKTAVGELVTYLNDAVLMAPSMLLVPEATFSEVDHDSFDVMLTDHGQSVSARVFVDEAGRVTEFSTANRMLPDPMQSEGVVRARWSTPVTGWTIADGRPVVGGAKAIWHLPTGDFEYADLGFADFEFNVPPSAPML